MSTMSAHLLDPPALVNDSAAMSPRLVYDDIFREQLRRLSQLRAWRGCASIAADWFVIGAAFASALCWPHPALWIVAALLVASRQHALLIIMHDAAHYRLLPSRFWNDRISNWFLAWPLLVTTEGYRQNHLAHHRYLNTDADPDWVRKQGHSEWEFPKTRWQFWRLLLRDLLGGGILDQLGAIGNLSRDPSSQDRSRAALVERLAYYSLLAAGITLLGWWLPVLCLWFAPAFTVLPVILRIRSIAEHFGVEQQCELDSSRNMHPALWERLTVAPHNVGFHLDHHLFPSVPFYHLPQLHQALCRQPGYTQSSHQSRSLFSSDPSSVISEVTIAG